MRNNQNPPNRKFDSNNVNGRQYHQHHQSIAIHEAEHYIDHNQEMDITISQIVETIEITKDLENLIQVTMIEA